MEKKENCSYGIYFNGDIPKLDKINQYHKKVKITFEGKAYLIQRDKEEIIERIEIKNEYVLKKEKDYEIEFINKKNEHYDLQLRIETSFLFLFLLLFLIGFIIIFLLCKPAQKGDSALARFLDYISLSILEFDKKNAKVDEKSGQNQYDFNVSFQNEVSADIDLKNTIFSIGSVKSKIAPGVSGSFSIVIDNSNSTLNRDYQIKFQDLTNQKPSNMTFKMQNTNTIYGSLQELQRDLQGEIKQKSKKTILIDWQWNYESGEQESTILANDRIDTREGKALESYKFKIIITGEEVL